MGGRREAREALRGALSDPIGLSARRIIKRLLQEIRVGPPGELKPLARSFWDAASLAAAASSVSGDRCCGACGSAIHRHGPAAWADGSWEAGIPRTTADCPDREDRIKAIGNGQVPAAFAAAFLSLAERAGLIRRESDGGWEWRIR